MTSLNVSNMQISSSLDSTKIRREINLGSPRYSGKLFQMIGPKTLKHHLLYVEFHWRDSKLASVYGPKTVLR